MCGSIPTGWCLLVKVRAFIAVLTSTSGGEVLARSVVVADTRPPTRLGFLTIFLLPRWFRPDI